jgi:hypothetical protein
MPTRFAMLASTSLQVCPRTAASSTSCPDKYAHALRHSQIHVIEDMCQRIAASLMPCSWIMNRLHFACTMIYELMLRKYSHSTMFYKILNIDYQKQIDVAM